MSDLHRSPSFPLYVDDLLAGTLHFTDAEIGIFVRLLCMEWMKGGLPDDPKELRDYGRGNTPLARVLKKFKRGEDGLLWNARLEAVRADQALFRAGKIKSGRFGANKRWQNHSSAIAKAPETDSKAIAQQVESDSKGVAKNSLPLPLPLPLPPLSKERGSEPPTESPASPLVKLMNEVLEYWNESPLPKCLVLSTGRKTKLKARLRDPFFLENWSRAIDLASLSKFCKGETERGWKASFDWFLQPDVVAKIVEGKYANTATLALSEARQLSIYEMTQVIKVKEELRLRLRMKSQGGDNVWTNKEDRAEFIKLGKELRALQVKIGSIT